ncbi:MAG TPA: hypothetical protein VGN83_07420 [Falsiroseomonas sp.]|jgi:hypothetical protein|nr:hypothetical protein [Falsiroseomonas sp.]
MPTDGTGPGKDGQGIQPHAGGLLDDPRLLAAGTAGLVASILALWAFRGMPLGVVAFWAVPLPLFLAGIGFGTAALLLSVGLAALLVWLAGTAIGAWLFLIAFGIPASLLVIAARATGGLGLPLALLGLLPAATIIGAALWLADMPGGLEGTLAVLTEAALQNLQMAGSAELVAEIVRVKAAAIGFWLALALLANGWLAGWVLARATIAAPPAWSSARLPAWYAVAPGLVFGLWMAAEDGADAVPLSIFLVLLVPLLLHGLATLHRRTRGRGGRRVLLGGVYMALVVMFVPASLAVVGYGAFDLLRSSSNTGGGGRGAPPPRS